MEDISQTSPGPVSALPISSSGTPSVIDTISRYFPVPAAHRSFIAKLSALPSGPRPMSFESCPPMSITVRALGKRYEAPLAWQRISETTLSASSK
jgi:hypothetical protein